MTDIPKNPLVLIDGSSYFYRAFHALPPLSNSKGEPTGAVYGVINMIKRLIKDYQPDRFAVIFDAKGKTFRDDIYPEYKANRPPMPDDLRGQFQPLVDIIQALGFPLLIVDGVEADDVIGTLAVQAMKAGHHTLISTGDKDMAQLVNPQVTLMNTMTNTTMDESGVVEKFGIPPSLIIDYLTLMGDKVDNIPGIPNVGPKTAVKWLTQYKSLQGVIDHADEIKGKVGDNLRTNLETLPLCQTLVTIKTDVKLPIVLDGLRMQEPDRTKLVELYQRMEFRTWLSDLLDKEPQNESSDYQTILSEDDFQTWLAALKKADIISVDLETTSLNYMDAEIVGLSFAFEMNTAIYIPVGHDYLDAPTQLDRDKVLSQLKPLLEDPTKKKLGQNLKYDMSVLANYGITLRGIAFDTMLESYVLNSTAVRHNMDSLALKYLGKNTITFEDVAGKGVKQLTFNQIDVEKAGTYAAEDADIPLQLHEVLWPRIEKEKGLKFTFEKIEMPLIGILSEIERRGVLLDIDLLNKQSKELAVRIEDLQEEAHACAGEEFNLGSPKQLQSILFDKLKLPILKKTPKGQPSTAEGVLQELAPDYPLPKLILEYRSLSKLKSTYTDALPEQVNAKTGRVHTSYNQAVAATGRLSSTEPNLQNIPVRTEEGRRIRKAFIAPSGYKIVAADYSQIELRIMAHLSNDKGLFEAFLNGYDIHRATAAEVFGVEIEKVSSEQRRNAKAINFGLIYGMSAYGLSRQLGLSREEAQNYIDLYFERYPGVHKYMEDTRKKAHETGFVETLYGRCLYLPEINARNFQRQQAAERTAINAPMQGTAADLIKMAMINIHQFLSESDYDAFMIMQVHDELVFEVKSDQVEELVPHIEKCMCEVVKLAVPIEVHTGIGDNWEVAH